MIFGKITTYIFVLFCILPLVAGLLVPYWFSLSKEPFAALAPRFILLAATSGVSFVVLLIPALTLVRWRRFLSAYVFGLFPLSLSSLAAQSIMYREFGTEINTRVVGLFQGNLPALWAFACKEYHVHWVVAAVLIASAVLTLGICRPGRSAKWLPPVGIWVTIGMIFVASGALAIGLRLNIATADHYHPSKLSSAPLFQIVLLSRHLLGEHDAGYRQILERAGEVTGSEREEITRRLGATPERFCERTSDPPDWLKAKPTHVFLFLLESFGYELIDHSPFDGLTPCLARFAEEGVSVPNFGAGGYSTIDAVHSILAGASCQTRYPVPRALTQYELDTLPKLMARGGYRPVFLAASYRQFGSKGDVSEAYGYEEFVGCPDVAEGIRKNEWGVSDGDFFTWAGARLANLRSPHFVTFLNVSNHAPYDAPLDELDEGHRVSEAALNQFAGKSRNDKLRYARHISYADQMVGEAVEVLSSRYPGALFIFTGDHSGARMHIDPMLRVPLVLWGKNVIEEGVDSSRWFGSHMDLPATLANLVLPEGDQFRTLGEAVWCDDLNRVSCAKDYLFTGAGCLNRAGATVALPPDAPRSGSASARAALTSAELVRKASAIDALSWGFLYARPLP